MTGTARTNFETKQIECETEANFKSLNTSIYFKGTYEYEYNTLAINCKINFLGSIMEIKKLVLNMWLGLDHQLITRKTFTVKELKKEHILIVEDQITCLNNTRKPSKEELEEFKEKRKQDELNGGYKKLFFELSMWKTLKVAKNALEQEK